MSDEQKQTAVLYTAMPSHWNDANCLKIISAFMKSEMPLYGTFNEIVSKQDNARVARVTIDILDGTLADHRTGETD